MITANTANSIFIFIYDDNINNMNMNNLLT